MVVSQEAPGANCESTPTRASAELLTLTTVMLNVCEAELPAESAAFSVKMNVPALVGVPVISAPASPSPAGSKDPVATDHVYGATPPVTVRSWL